MFVVSTPAKQQAIDELNDVFSRAKSAVLANYQGIPAHELTAFRAEMKSRSLDFRVAKNTLAQIAAKNTSFEALETQFKGPVSMLVSFDDLVAPAKALADYAKSGAKNNPKSSAGWSKAKPSPRRKSRFCLICPPGRSCFPRCFPFFRDPPPNLRVCSAVCCAKWSRLWKPSRRKKPKVEVGRTWVQDKYRLFNFEI